MLISLSVLIRFAAIELQISLKRSSGQTFVTILDVRVVVLIPIDYTHKSKYINELYMLEYVFYTDTKTHINRQKVEFKQKCRHLQYRCQYVIRAVV